MGSERQSKADLTLAGLCAKMPKLAWDLAKVLVAFLAKDRSNSESVLEHPFFSELHDVEDEPSREPLDPGIFQFEFRKLPIDAYREEIAIEVSKHYKEFSTACSSSYD